MALFHFYVFFFFLHFSIPFSPHYVWMLKNMNSLLENAKLLIVSSF